MCGSDFDMQADKFEAVSVATREVIPGKVNGFILQHIKENNPKTLLVRKSEYSAGLFLGYAGEGVTTEVIIRRKAPLEMISRQDLVADVYQ